MSERYCVATDCSRWYDIETNEIVNDMKTVETVYIQAEMLDPKEQSVDFQLAMKYNKEISIQAGDTKTYCDDCD